MRLLLTTLIGFIHNLLTRTSYTRALIMEAGKVVDVYHPTNTVSFEDFLSEEVEEVAVEEVSTITYISKRMVPAAIQEIGDACGIDEDTDDVIDNEDNCPEVFNPSQGDFDGDRMENACDEDLDDESWELEQLQLSLEVTRPSKTRKNKKRKVSFGKSRRINGRLIHYRWI